MRISDWSSDVCSSDLGKHVGALGMAAVIVAGAGLAFRIGLDEEAAEIGNRGVDLVGLGAPPCGDVRIERRSEEHTSELQSLMRISYAVFCLNTINTIIKTIEH